MLSVVLCACKKDRDVDQAASQIDLQLKVHRFDQDFFTASPQQLPQLKKRYPFFFPANNPDQVWIDKMQNPQWQELYRAVQAQYADFDPWADQLEDMFKRIQVLYPKFKAPEVYTIVGDMDFLYKTIYADQKLIIPLELYLGRSSKYYANEFPRYIADRFDPSQLLPDAAAALGAEMFAADKDPSLLARMIDAGKMLYIKQTLLPEVPEHDLMGYNPTQWQWCVENEPYMWQYFVEKGLLFSTEPKLSNRFINPAPFSKFYLEIDNESPGQVGVWLGWQMVKSYAEHHPQSLPELLKVPAKTLFEQAQYKPRKHE